MGLFRSGEKEARKQFAAQLDAQNAGTDMALIQQMAEQGNVAYDPQVSALILECKRRFLPWKPDLKNNSLYLPAKYSGLKEPMSSDDIMSFLNDEEKKIVSEGFLLLQEYFTIGEKYGFTDNVVRAFNSVVSGIESFAHVSRMDGKNVKVSKSQYVEGTSNVTRFNNPKKKNDFLGGLFG